ncbi:MAG TPA: hypothetical protein V6D10_18685 [Trichocoleus sp.]|jgi:hypothetical protein
MKMLAAYLALLSVPTAFGMFADFNRPSQPHSEPSAVEAAQPTSSDTAQLINLASNLAQQSRYKDAILAITGVANNDPLYTQAHQLQNEWANEILTRAIHKYEQGEVSQAIAILKSIPEGTYAAQPSKELAAYWSKQ